MLTTKICEFVRKDVCFISFNNEESQTADKQEK